MISETIDFNTFNYDLIVIVRKNFLDNTYDINKNILEKLVKKVTIKQIRLQEKINEKKS